MKSLAEITTSVKGRIALELATPVVLDLDDDAIERLCNDLAPNVIEALSGDEIEVLREDVSLTHTPGTASVTLPVDFEKMGTVLLDNKRAAVYPSFDDFASFDSSSALLTPSVYIASVNGTSLHIFPVTTVEVKLKYYRKHPTISSSQSTLWRSKGDKILENMIVSSYFVAAGEGERAGFEMGSKSE